MFTNAALEAGTAVDLARALSSMGETNGAPRYTTRALGVLPRFEPAMVVRGSILLRARRAPEAVRAFEEVLEAHAGHPTARGSRTMLIRMSTQSHRHRVLPANHRSAGLRNDLVDAELDSTVTRRVGADRTREEVTRAARHCVAIAPARGVSLSGQAVDEARRLADKEPLLHSLEGWLRVNWDPANAGNHLQRQWPVHRF